MKTIQITDEQYEFLINLSKELKIQDNRITENPIYRVYQKITIVKADGFGNQVGYLDSEGHITRLEDLQKSGEIENYRKEHLEYSDEDDEYILENRLEYQKLEFSEEDISVSGQVYFTENAAATHIAANHYHYDHPFVFVESAWRNYEWQKIREIILSLDSEKK
jgi:hypothetical protein